MPPTLSQQRIEIHLAIEPRAPLAFGHQRTVLNRYRSDQYRTCRGSMEPLVLRASRDLSWLLSFALNPTKISPFLQHATPTSGLYNRPRKALTGLSSTRERIPDRPLSAGPAHTSLLMQRGHAGSVPNADAARSNPAGTSP